MMFAYALFMGILSLFSVSASAASGFALVDWDRIIDKDNHSKILFGVNLLGPAPYARGPETHFKPASLSKLFTTAEALNHLGPGYRIRTTLQWQPIIELHTGRVVAGTITGLTLIGGGDPTWGLEEFGESPQSRIDWLVAELQRRGIKQVTGDIQVIADDPRWSQLRAPEGWNESERLSCDGALAQAFNVQRNCSTYVVTGSKQGFWQDYGVATPVKLKLRNGNKTDLDVFEAGEGYEIRGTIRKRESRGGYSIRLPVKNVDQWVKNLLLNSLNRSGIVVTRALSKGFRIRSEMEMETLVMESPALQEILKPLLKNSVNLIGDALFKIIGRETQPGEPDLIAAGQAAMRNFVSTLGPRTQASLWDGSGLSHDSRVTPATMTMLLDYLRRRPDFPVVWDALATAGVDGTLQERMKGTPAQGVLRGKTGTLNGTYNLAGYVPKTGPDGSVNDYIPFVIMTQTTPDEKATARAAADRVGATLAEIAVTRPPLVMTFRRNGS
jgi:D-alanyl-D-alanine carboxypeptidase/D-alanyl-D-alanine-endopeptidase (penicillin-binding protein 4)